MCNITKGKERQKYKRFKLWENAKRPVYATGFKWFIEVAIGCNKINVKKE